MDKSVSIMQNRINKLGVSEPEIRKQGNNQIVIQLAGVHDPAAAAALIGKTAQLMLFDFENDLAGPSRDVNGNPVATPTLYGLLTQVQKQAAKGSPSQYYLFKTTTTVTPAKKVKGKTVGKPTVTTKHSLVAGPANTKQALLRPYGGTPPPGTKVLAVPQTNIIVKCPVANGCIGVRQGQVSTSGTYYYLMKYAPTNKIDPVPEMNGSDLVLSGTKADFGPNGNPIVLLQFTNHGSNQFQKITRDEAQRGQSIYNLAGKQGNYLNYVQHFAIVLDGVLQSTPYIDFKQNPDGIPGPNAQIDMGNGGTFKDAQDLALVLQTGALPVSFVQIERTDVSATLGKDSLTQAWHAALVGLVLVAIFLLVFYRFLGLVAVAGLAIYALFYYAAILLFNVTLTLPGFAGLILTIGVAADANVVVFERIKEEVRSGKSVKAAISAGYGKGFHTILDANVVTAITALVLFLIAVASVKGFALMLLIGTMISLLTAVVATRAMLGLLAGFSWFDNPRFMGASGQQTAKWLQIDFIKRRNTWFAISGAIILAGLISIGVRGLNLGIDFKGGTQITFNTHKGYTQPQVQHVVAQAGRARRGRPGPGLVDERHVSAVAGPDEVADRAGADEAGGEPHTRPGRVRVRGEERLLELRPPDRNRRDLGNHRLDDPDHDLHHAALRPEVRDPGDPGDAARHPDHDRDLLDHVQGGLGRHRRRGADRARVLDLRHDHHLRPHPRERAADATAAVRHDRERLDLGDDPPFAGDDVHHAAADRGAPGARRGDAEGLRVRTARRRRPPAPTRRSSSRRRCSPCGRNGASRSSRSGRSLRRPVRSRRWTARASG